MKEGKAGLSAAPLVGAILGRYVLGQLLGEGGMGAVYEATHQDLGKRVAIKTLHPRFAESSEARERFLREGRAAARIRHPNVADVYDVGIDGEHPYLVMELLEGEDLARLLLREGPLSVQRAADLLVPVSAAVEAAHALAVVHRDLKPQNIFLCRERNGITPKVLDFGIAKLTDGEASSASTGTGTVLGTPHYMSPEQAHGGIAIDARSDQYSLGVVLYQMVTGHLPMEGVPLYALILKTVQGDFLPPRQLVPELPSAFEELILRAMGRLPELRFSTTRALGEALLAFASASVRSAYSVELAAGRAAPSLAPLEVRPFSSSELQETQSYRAISPATARTARRVWWAALSLAALSAAGLGIWRVQGRSQLAAPVCGLPGLGTSEACGSCMEQHCCEQAGQCAKAEGCAVIEACVQGCAAGDALCQEQCGADNASTARIREGVASCRAQSCAGQCLPEPWACLEKVRWHSPSTPPRMISIRTTAVCGSCGAGGGPAPLAGASVRVCSLADPACHLPLASSTSDMNGTVSLTLDTSIYVPPLAVFLEYRKDGYIDTLLHLNSPPVSGDRDVGAVYLLESKAQLSAFAAKFGTSPDPTRAHASVFPTDCNGAFATRSVAVTWVDGDDQTATRPYITPGGFAAAANLPVNKAGLTRIVARVAETKQLVATTNVVVRPSAMTVVILGPSP